MKIVTVPAVVIIYHSQSMFFLTVYLFFSLNFADYVFKSFYSAKINNKKINNHCVFILLP